MTATHNLPLAAAGLDSYRYVGPYGYIMIGAKSDKDALNEARRSLESGKPDVAQLEKWDGTRYVRVQPVKVGHEHCQICGRHIKAKLGLIAHHGYTRPGQGWQTSSCMGARYRCYEVAHDALDAAIIHCTNALAHAVDLFAEFMTNAPQGILWERRERDGRPTGRWSDAPRSILRPEGFDPQAYKVQGSYSSHIGPAYQDVFEWQVREHVSTIRHTMQSLQFLKQRRADWKPPHG